MKKLFRPLYRQLVEDLPLIFDQGKTASVALEKSFKSHPKWGARDRKLYAETIYEIVRWKIPLFYKAELLMSMVYTQDFYYNLIQVFCYENDIQLPDEERLPTRKMKEYAKAIEEKKSKFQKLTHKYSFPEWLVQEFEKNFGKDVNAILNELNQPASVYLRVNTFKAKPHEVAASLRDEGIDVIQDHDIKSLLYLRERKNVFRTQAFKLGQFEVQDGGSQHIATFLDPKPGEFIMDACSGGGGKSLHIADLIQDKGRVLCLDIYDWKLKELKKRNKRIPFSCIETRLIEGTKTIKRLAGKVDKLLLDVPCSGSGVYKRNPDGKWKVTPESYANIKKTQAEILQSYSRVLKPEGILVYSTCSVFFDENRGQVDLFLKANPNFDFVEEQEILPGDFDGFYMAKLRKKP